MSVIITIRNVEVAETDVLGSVLEHMKHFCAPDTVTIEIVCSARVPTSAPPHRNPGMCEYICTVRSEKRPMHTVHAVQHFAGGATEFYS